MQTVAERNEGFWEMSPEMRRVAVARDVLARLDAREIAALRGYYAEPPSMLVEQFGETLTEEESGAACVVCAIGAAAVSVFDGEMIGRRGYEMTVRLSSSGVFLTSDLREMERVFEGHNVLARDLGRETFAQEGRVTYFPHSSPEEVMRLIYQNIIDHGGQFTIRPLAEEALAQWQEIERAGGVTRPA